MPVTNVKSKWVSGNLVFYDASTNEIVTFDGTNRELSFPSGASLDVKSGGALKLAGTQVYPTVTAEVLFTETGAGTYTGTIALPAGSRIIDIGVDGQALWTAGTSASLVVGDGSDPDGFFTATNLKATDLLAGEINNLEHPGGKAGAYIVNEQRNLYTAAARNVIGVVTSVGTGTAGRTRMYVCYANPTAGAATKA